MDRLRGDAERLAAEQFQKEGPEALLLRMFHALPPQMDGGMVEPLLKDLASQRDALKTDPWGNELLALYDAANKNGPVSPMLVVAVDPAGDDAVYEWSVLAAFDEARALRRERRSQRLFDAVPDLVDRVYQR
jgi:hypothetical protein